MSAITLINNTDTGIATDDKLSNKPRPEVSFTSESGLRAFVVQENSSGNKVSLVQDTDSFSEDSGTYTVTFLKDLSDSKYIVSTEDDFGNKNVVATGNTDQNFLIDRTNPPFSKIQLINGTDRGVDTNDRYTAEKKPIVNFTAEPGLRVYVDHSDGTTTTASSSSKYIIDRGFQNPEYDLQALYTIEAGNIISTEIKVVNSGGQISLLNKF